MAGITQAKKLIRDKVSQRARPGRSGGALLRQQFQFFDLDGGGGIDRAGFDQARKDLQASIQRINGVPTQDLADFASTPPLAIPPPQELFLGPKKYLLQ